MDSRNTKTPVLQIAGAQDLCVPVSQAAYDGGGHGVSKISAYIDMCVGIVGWFEGHLGP
jgi:hypothetical protein